MHFQSNAVSQAVAELLAIARPFNVLSRDGVGIPPGHPRSHARGRALIRDPHHFIDRAMLVAGLADHHRARHVRAVTAHFGPEIHQEKLARFDHAWRRAGMRKCGARTAGDDGRKRKAFTPFIPQGLLQHAGHGQLGHARVEQREGATEGARGHVGRVRDARDFLLILSLPERLHKVTRGAPLPPRAGLHEPLEIAVLDVRRLEPDDASGHQRGELRPEPRPEARRLDRNPGDVADLLRHLRLVAKIGDEHDLARRHDEQRTRPGEPREVADVREPGQQHAVDMRGGKLVHQRGNARGARIAHVIVPRAVSVATSPRRASS